MNDDKILLPDVNALIVEKLANYPEDVRELSMQAICLAETYPEIAVADQLQSVVRKLTKQSEGATS
jgi:hypothetical protein